LLNEYAVFWTSTQITATKARERYLVYDTSACLPYNWFKVMKYSIRCLRDVGVGADEIKSHDPIQIQNPVDGYLRIMNQTIPVIKKIEIVNM